MEKSNTHRGTLPSLPKSPQRTTSLLNSQPDILHGAKMKSHKQTKQLSSLRKDNLIYEKLFPAHVRVKSTLLGAGCLAFGTDVPVRVVPLPADGLTAMSSHLRQAHRSRSIRLTPARDCAVCRRYLEENRASLFRSRQKTLQDKVATATIGIVVVLLMTLHLLSSSFTKHCLMIFITANFTRLGIIRVEL